MPTPLLFVLALSFSTAWAGSSSAPASDGDPGGDGDKVACTPGEERCDPSATEITCNNVDENCDGSFGPFSVQIDGPMSLVKGRAYGNATVPVERGVTWSFWIYPKSKVSSWGNILHLGSTDDARTPAVFFFPRQTRLHIGMSTNARPGAACDTAGELVLNTWSHVAITYTPGTPNGVMRVYVRGTLNNTCANYPALLPQGPARLWLTNPWTQVARATIDKVRAECFARTPAQVLALNNADPRGAAPLPPNNLRVQ